MRGRSPITGHLREFSGLLVAVFLAAVVTASPPRSGMTATTAPSDAASKPEWVGEIRNARDVTGKGSWFKRAMKAIAGIDDRQRALLQPEGIAVDGLGRVLVADPRAGVVRMFDARRKRYKELRAPGSNPMVAPVDVAVDGSGNIYVSDAARARIFVFSAHGKFLRTIGGLGREESIFLRCTGIAVDARRRLLYVVDTAAMRVVVLTLGGRVIRRIGKRGTGPGEFNFPTFIAVAPDGGFWVSDSLNFRVEHFDAKGAFLSAFGRNGTAPGDFYRPKGIAVDRHGNVYVVEGMYDRVQVYHPDGRLLFLFGGTGSGPGQLDLPTGIALSGNGGILVSDALNARVDIFRSGASGAIGKPGEGN